MFKKIKNKAVRIGLALAVAIFIAGAPVAGSTVLAAGGPSSGGTNNGGG